MDVRLIEMKKFIAHNMVQLKSSRSGRTMFFGHVKDSAVSFGQFNQLS